MVITVALLVVVLAASILVYTQIINKKVPIKIGAILPITGIGSYYGEEVKNGLSMAIEEINAWGGINGRELELIIEDSKSNPEEGAKAFQKIESESHPDLFISVLSSVSTQVVPLAEENQVPLVGLVVMATQFTAGHEWVFRFYAMPRDEMPAVTSILEKLKIARLGILYINDEYGRSTFELLREKFENEGRTTVSESFETADKDFSEKISAVGDTEAIYAVGYTAHMTGVFKQIRETNYQGVLIAGLSVAAPDIRKMPQFDGVYVAAPAVYNPNYPFAGKLKEQYETRYKKDLSHHAASGYDFIKLLDSLLEDKEISRPGIKAALDSGFVYPGIFGEINHKSGEHDIPFPLHPARIVNGELEYLYIME